MGVLTDFIRWLPGYFFPKICYGCGKEGAYVCEECRKTVERVLDEPRCAECGREAAFGATHPVCRRKYGLDGLISYYKYAGWAKEIVKEAKFGKHHRYGAMKELSGEMALAISTGKSETRISKLETNSNNQNSKFKTVSDLEHSNFDNCFGFRPPAGEAGISDFGFFQSSNRIVVPIPLHWWREFKRGFNQAELIARELAGRWKIPMVKMMVRKAYTEPQTLMEKEIKLTKEQEEKLEKKYKSSLQLSAARKKLLNQLKAKKRRENIKGAFRLVSDLKTQSVLLVDDVWTSGATMKECCRVLKKTGVKRVWGITLLRA